MVDAHSPRGLRASKLAPQFECFFRQSLRPHDVVQRDTGSNLAAPLSFASEMQRNLLIVHSLVLFGGSESHRDFERTRVLENHGRVLEDDLHQERNWQADLQCVHGRAVRELLRFVHQSIPTQGRAVVGRHAVQRSCLSPKFPAVLASVQWPHCAPHVGAKNIFPKKRNLFANDRRERDVVKIARYAHQEHPFVDFLLVPMRFKGRSVKDPDHALAVWLGRVRRHS